jgi:EAL domain-containing protein (putative c-di-GMP-specific phosphodiesterase class I)
VQVIAEGVETDSQLALLRERGCHVIQGHLISKPLQADELAPLLCRPTGTLIV